jgi:predicted TIM-barrel fold metal-dependent hydrolase
MNQIFDLYFQLGTDHWLRGNRPALPHQSSAADLERQAAIFQAAGYQLAGAALVPFPSVPDRDYAAANELVAGAARTGVAAAVPVAAIHAVIPGDERSVRSVADRIAGGEPCLGIKLWPYMGGFSLSALREDRRLLDLVIRHRLLVFMHVGTGREVLDRAAFPPVAADPSAAMDVVCSLPEIDFVAGHLLRLSRPALERAARVDNVFIDTSGLSSIGRWREGGRPGLPADDAGSLADLSAGELLAALIDDLGLQRRLVFGTNYPFCGWWGSIPLGEAALIDYAPIAPQARRDILFTNAARLVRNHGVPAVPEGRSG